MESGSISENTMGAHGPRTLKKRTSPPPIEDGDVESPQKRHRSHEAAGKENADVGSVPAAAETPDDLGLKPAECGVITQIHCENFMCHRSFTVNFCRNVNFIYGQNGSGKSAILAAIQICLGAGARRTHRARNLKDLVRKDSSAGYAKVRVTLLNKGDDAYNHDIYGDKITVERTIATRGGYNGYKLYDDKGKEQSRSKKDLDELLDKVNAQVENPVAILDQEEAKKFLTGKAEDKYAFFMKATELERIDRSIASTMDKIEELKDQEKRMELAVIDDLEIVQETKKQYEQHKEIEKIKRKLHGCEEAYAWAVYKEANTRLQDQVDVSNYVPVPCSSYCRGNRTFIICSATVC
jgi:chromosome segregation ATPase